MVVVKNVTIGNTKDQRAVTIDTIIEDSKSTVRSTFVGMDKFNEARHITVNLSPREALIYAAFLHDVARGLEECEEKEYESK